MLCGGHVPTFTSVSVPGRQRLPVIRVFSVWKCQTLSRLLYHSLKIERVAVIRHSTKAVIVSQAAETIEVTAIDGTRPTARYVSRYRKTA